MLNHWHHIRWHVLHSLWVIALQWPALVSGETLPAGDIPNTETKSLGHVSGYTLSGSGDGQYILPGKRLRGDMTAFVRTGDSDVPMIAMPGVNQHLERVTLQGNDKATGVLISRPELAGLGTGKSTIEDVSFNGLQCAIQFGERLVQSNADNCKLRSLNITNCNIAVRQCNTQALCNSVDGLRCMFVKEVYRIEAGGKFHATDTTIKDLREPCTVLHLVGTGKINKQGIRVEQGIGNNADIFRLDHTTVDNTADSWLCLVRMAEHFTAGPTIILDGGMISDDDYRAEMNYQAVLKNPGTLELARFDGLQTGTFWVEDNGTSPPLKLLAWNCEINGPDMDGDGDIDAADLIAPECPGAKRVHVVGGYCHDARGNSLPPVEVQP